MQVLISWWFQFGSRALGFCDTPEKSHIIVKPFMISTMKHYRTILLLLATVLFSCTQKGSWQQYEPLVLLDHSITGESPSGEYALVDFGVDKDLNSFMAGIRPVEFDRALNSPEQADALHISSINGELYKTATKAEAFAFEQITKRNLPLKEKFEQYCRQLKDRDEFRVNSPHVSFVHVYVRGPVSIRADDALFGQPAGTDLSEWFRFGDRNVIGVIGTDYKMVERVDLANSFQRASEYFITDMMLPSQFYIRTVGLPEEISLPEDHYLRFSGDDIINVTFSLPVRFERYWDWCLALYSNPDAEERFENGEIQVVIPFVRKQ